MPSSRTGWNRRISILAVLFASFAVVPLLPLAAAAPDRAQAAALANPSGGQADLRPQPMDGDPGSPEPAPEQPTPPVIPPRNPAPQMSTGLTYTLSSPLKKDFCAGDSDHDCLDNAEETALAWAVAPWYFYDEDENCSARSNRFGAPSYHFARVDYFQVRPVVDGIYSTSPVTAWNADYVASGTKQVAVVFFLNYPHDCLGVGGHQGDGERVVFYLRSVDLRFWVVHRATYDHHSNQPTYSGADLAARAIQLGTAWASVAADEDSHGSWPGDLTSNDRCAADLEGYLLSDCFVGSWRDDFLQRRADYPKALRNVGGPSPENWIGSTISVVSATEAFSSLDVGHGVNAEYWTPRTDKYNDFCGWECSARSSLTDCLNIIHERSHCSGGPLWTKVLYGDFGYPAGSLPPRPALAASAAAQRAQALAAASVSRRAPLSPEQRARARRGRQLTVQRAEAMRLAARQRRAEGRIDDEMKRLERLAADPMAAAVPMLLEMEAADRMRILGWVMSVPDKGRLMGLFDDMEIPAGGSARQLAAQADAAAGRVLDLIAMMEEEGFEAPVIPGEPLARVVSEGIEKALGVPAVP